MSEAKGHGKAFIQSTVGQHPVATFVVMAALVLLIIVLAFYVNKYKAVAEKGNFGVRSTHNLNTGGNNPLWWHGSGDAGWGGPVHREATEIHAAAYMPHLRKGPQVEHSHMHQARRRREGLATGPDMGDDFGLPSACGQWDPAASAEAQALATVGSLQHDSHGERKLQSAINVAYDGNVGISNAELQELMHQGGTP